MNPREKVVDGVLYEMCWCDNLWHQFPRKNCKTCGGTGWIKKEDESDPCVILKGEE